MPEVDDFGRFDPPIQHLEVIDLTVHGDQTIKQDETLQGDTTIGDEASDNLNINATLNTDFALGDNQLTGANLLSFNAISDPAHSEGQLWYSNDTNTLSFHIDRSAVTLNIGEEQWTRVRNNTGSQISNGEVVTISGFDSNSGLPEVALAQADSFTTSNVAGVATEDIADGGTGIITRGGYVRNTDTSNFDSGNTLWLSASTAGAKVSTEPQAPNFSVRIGYVARSHASAGQLVVDLGERRASIFTSGSVLFADPSGRMSEDNENFSWDNTNEVLAVPNIDLLNQGSGNDPRLSSNSSSKRLLVQDELEINNVGAGSNPVIFSSGSAQTAFITGNLHPNNDDSNSFGDGNNRWNAVHSTQFMVEAAASDDNPAVQVDSDGVKFGPGGGTGLDTSLVRGSSNTLRIEDTGGSAVDLELSQLTAFGGVTTDQVKSRSNQNTEILARDSDDGTLTTVATLNRASTPTFDLDQARVPTGASALEFGSDWDISADSSTSPTFANLPSGADTANPGGDGWIELNVNGTTVYVPYWV